MADLSVLPRLAESLQALAEKLEHTRPAEKEKVASVPQCEQLAKTPERLLSKAKRNKTIIPDRTMGKRAAPWRDSGSMNRKG